MSVPAESIGLPVARTGFENVLVAQAAPSSAAAEQYRVLAHRLERIGASRPLRVVAVTSATRGEGRSTIAANLALTAAQEGRETILVECDVRKPSLATLFDLAPRAWLAQVLDGSAELSQALCPVGPLSVLCAGDARDPMAVLRSPRLGPLLDTLRATYALVVLDAPPALAFADAGRLATAADGAVLVVRVHATPRDVVRMAVDSLGDKVVGVVLNGVDAEAAPHARYLYPDSAAA
jgi:protein-tyrosine kinase